MSEGLLACGDLFINRFEDGVWGGFNPAGNATKFEIKPNASLKSRISKSCAGYGQEVDSVAIPAPTEVSIEVDELNKENLAIAFLGTSNAITVGASSVTDEAHTVATPNQTIRLAKGNVSNVTITKGGTELAEGKDYNIVNAKVGLIKMVAVGEVKVFYQAGAITANKTTGGDKSLVKLAYLLVGKNLVTGEPLQCEVWDTTVTPTSPVDFLAEDFVTLSLSGNAKFVQEKGSSFEVLTKIQNA